MTINELAMARAKEIALRKEEILEAFIAKYGYAPDEMVICEQPSTGKFWVEKRSKMTEWISIKEKHPDKDGRYLVVEDHQYTWVGVSTMRNGKFDMPITHWMDLPRIPNDK